MRLFNYQLNVPKFSPAAIGGAAGNLADRFIEQAKKFIGQPYLWGGGHGSKTGIQRVDCSGLVLQAARMVGGINLDGAARHQQKMGQPVSMNDLKPGDLLFKGNPATHVGIYLGDDKFLHAPKTGDVVKIDSLNSYKSFDNARRVFDKPGQAASEAPAAPAPLPQDTYVPAPPPIAPPPPPPPIVPPPPPPPPPIAPPPPPPIPMGYAPTAYAPAPMAYAPAPALAAPPAALPAAPTPSGPPASNGQRVSTVYDRNRTLGAAAQAQAAVDQISDRLKGIMRGMHA